MHASPKIGALTAGLIYINPDLTPFESQAAFEDRQRRRARAASSTQQMQLQTAQLSPSAASFVPRQQDT